MTSLSAGQENILRRDFIIYALFQASSDGLKSQLLLEFATLHFPDRWRRSNSNATKPTGKSMKR
jgi:hypothetical protein